jgi:hypothetical protein
MNGKYFWFLSLLLLISDHIELNQKLYQRPTARDDTVAAVMDRKLKSPHIYLTFVSAWDIR